MSRKIPGYLHFRPRNKARVCIDGKTIYLAGAYGSSESRAHYDRLISEYLSRVDTPELLDLRISDLCLAYLGHANDYYQKDGVVTSEVSAVQSAFRPLVSCYKALPVAEFGPVKLKAVRQKMIELGWVRSGINAAIKRIVRMLSWGVENEMVPPHVHASCAQVRNLQKGRSNAPEGSDVQPVSLANVDAVKPFVARQIWGMIQLQLATGMRPQEARLIRHQDIDRTDQAAWAYKPTRHKMQHRGRNRTIFIGPRGQEVLNQFPNADPEAYVFSPAEAYRELRELKRSNRQTPVTPSQAARKPVTSPRRSAGKMYSKDSYNRAIKRACVAAAVPVWSPNQLRHTAATAVRQNLDLDAARVVLGHSEKSTTEIYAERDQELAKSIMARFG